MTDCLQRPLDAPAPGPSCANPTLTMTTRLARAGLAVGLAAVGVTLLVKAHLGVAPFDVLITGVSARLDIRMSEAFILTGFVTCLVGVLLGGRPGWATVGGALVVSPLLELGLAMCPEPERLVARVPMMIAGMLLLGAAVCFIITAELGPGPLEVVMLGIVSRGVPVARARWGLDAVVTVIGLAIGGALGLGTLVFAMAFGPLVAIGLRRLRYTPEIRSVSA